VACEAAETVVGGDGGVLLRSNGRGWERIPGVEDDIWDLCWFEGTLYASAFDGVYRMTKKRMERVRIASPEPTTFQMATTKGALWSIGEFDVMSFDGKRWSRIV
jgi:hypothetical protein